MFASLHSDPGDCQLIRLCAQYARTLERAGADPKQGDECWFIAAHTWDLLPARSAGFKTAYVDFEEIYPCEEIYGKPDVFEDGLAKAAKKIVGEI